mgnify:CR=1 FL=1
MATLAGILPSAALADGFRIALGSSVQDPVGPLGVLIAWGTVAIALAVRTFRWE